MSDKLIPIAHDPEADYIDKLDQGKDRRFLICEGSCNPDLMDYDRLVDELNSGNHNRLISYLGQRARGLIHTLHESVGVRADWGPGGWQKKYRCLKCGHMRRF